MSNIHNWKQKWICLCLYDNHNLRTVNWGDLGHFFWQKLSYKENWGNMKLFIGFLANILSFLYQKGFIKILLSVQIFLILYFISWFEKVELWWLYPPLGWLWPVSHYTPAQQNCRGIILVSPSVCEPNFCPRDSYLITWGIILILWSYRPRKCDSLFFFF